MCVSERLMPQGFKKLLNDQGDAADNKVMKLKFLYHCRLSTMTTLLMMNRLLSIKGLSSKSWLKL